jgi:hypothetical protein
MITGFHFKVDEICALLGNYTVFSGITLQTFPAHHTSLLKMGLVGSPKMLVKNCHCTALQNFPEGSRSLIMNAPILSSECIVTT